MAPTFTVLGGANGSGKSSLFVHLAPPGEFVNADVTAKLINSQFPETASIAAGKLVRRRLKELIRDSRDFVYETTLSGSQSLNVMRSAKRRGFRVDLAFVVLADVELNVARVAQRVAEGGHDIPEAIIRRRYHGSLARLAEAICIANSVAILDNTTRRPEVLLRFKDGAIIENRLGDLPTHQRISKVLGDTLGL